MINQACFSTVIRATLIKVHITDIGQHIEITLKGVPKPDYTLSLFVGNVETGLQRSDNHTWAPTQGLYVSFLLITCMHSLKSVCVQRCFSNIRDASAGPNEKRPFILGKVFTDG